FLHFYWKTDLSGFGLEEDVIKCYADHGIVQLFPWQRDCLCLPGVLQGERNLVYTAPTSAGKTLVAEIILLKRVLETGKRGLFILPFISVAREKMLYLHSIYRNVGIQVQGYMGTLNPAGGMHSWDVAVCTIEKANSLINRLLEEDSMSSLGVIVVDELHLVKDRHRGKLLYHVRQQQFAYGPSNPIQIIGMSATLPNIEIYGKWLCSEIFRTDFRPVPLTEYLFSNGKFYTKNFELVRSLLCLETVIVGCGVLVFCSTKAWCERLALLIAEAIKELLDCSGSLTARLNALIESEKQKHFLDSFGTIAGVVDPVLRSTLPYAVGFHHAGLTMEERERLENGFRKSLVRVLVATSTLSSGVNLPAKRVISGPCLDSYMYKQMTGRAGRKGLDVQGMAKFYHLYKTDRLKLTYFPKLRKRRNCDAADIRASKETTLPYKLQTWGIQSYQWDPVQQCLFSLTERNFISCSAEGEPTLSHGCFKNLHFAEEISPTQLGCATVSSSMGPDEAVAVFQDLQTAKSAVVLENDLHLVYLVTLSYCQHGVTPLCMLDNLATTISWAQYFSIWQSLDEASRKVGQTVGVEESYLVEKLCSYGRRNVRKREVHLRFFVALALFQLVEEVPLAEVSARFSCNRGYLQSLQQQASTYAAMVISFVDRLGWFSLKNLLSGFAERLAFGVKQDLTELVQIDGIDGLRARRFHEAGLATVSKLAQSKIKEISSSSSKNSWLAGHSELTLVEAATFVRFQARTLLNDKLRQYGVTAKRMDEKEVEEDECNCFCASTAAWLLNPDSGRLHPKELLEIYCPADLPSLRFIPTSLGQASTCCMSSIAMCLVWPHLYELLERMHMLPAFKEIELPAQWAVAQMELTGIGFDSALCSSMCESLKGRIMELEFDSARLAGRQFNMSSPNEVAKVLFHELGLPADSSHLLSRGDAKRYSTSKPVLEKLCSVHPLPRNVLQWRQLSFALSSYVYPLLRTRSNKCFTRIYGKYDWFTATGRVIMHEPNLQNLPKKISLRNLVVARHGCILLSADFSQLELRIIAHLSGDPKLMSLLNDGQDIFAFLASELNSVCLTDVSEVQRSQAKQLLLPFLGVASWMQATVERCRHLGYAITIANRVQIKSSISSERCQAERRAINTTVQGSASDIFKLAVKAVCTRLQGKHYILLIHSVIICNHIDAFRKQCAYSESESHYAMEGAASLKVALVVKIKVGVRWGDMVEISL
ncbi:DNA polymerase theta, partial [Trichuris trichiura]